MLEAQLQHAQRMEAVGHLSGGIAHDFNNILTAIVGNVELALEELGPHHPTAANLRSVMTASARATNLVRQILTFARQRPHERHVIALGPVAEESLDLLRATIPASVEIVLRLGEDVPRVLADATQLQQVIVNLGTNAWHALENEPGRIEISIDAVDVGVEDARMLSDIRAGRCAHITVRDSGRGMVPAVMARIFDPFFTTKAPGSGTGLGLSVVHGIVRSHDGAIRVTSEPGRGSLFEVFVPAAPTSSRSTAEADVRVRSLGVGDVLFLDDESALVSIAKRSLERLGYRVTGFTRPASALEALRSEPDKFAALVTDMNMPEMSGLQLAAAAHELRRGLPVILMSGYITEELEREAHRRGIARVLYKPMTMRALGEAISGALEERSLE
jgi:CheY-like chemotaxis protein